MAKVPKEENSGGLKPNLQLFGEEKTGIMWACKDFDKIAKRTSPQDLIKNLENLKWTKTIEQGGSKSGPATILIDPKTGTKVRIHATPSEGNPYFRVQNNGGGYLADNGLFPSSATKQEMRDLTHFYFK